MIRRQVGRGPVELIDASPGNPTGIAYPDGDLTNAALPVGSSLTTPEQVRITTVATGRGATVQVTFEDPAAAPDAPVVDSVVQVGGEWRVRWSAPADNGQIVLGYRVTSLATGQTRYVRGPAGYRTSMQFRAELGESGTPAFTVEALNQQGWSPAGGTPAGTPPAVSDTPST
jgi:hypothetical protein